VRVASKVGEHSFGTLDLWVLELFVYMYAADGQTDKQTDRQTVGQTKATLIALSLRSEA